MKQTSLSSIWTIVQSARLLPAALLLSACVLPAARHAAPAPPAKAPAAKSQAAKRRVTRAPALKSVPAKRALAARPAPAFTLTSEDGKTHSPADYRGRPVVMFFYCGCGWCYRSAQSWSTIQRSGTLGHLTPPSGHNSTPPVLSNTLPATAAPLTLVVYTGDAAEVREFAGRTQLDLKQTVLLPDSDEKVTTLYQADPCPRVFVVDAGGSIRYTNNEQGKESYKIPAPLIAARTVDALRAVSAGPAAPAKNQKKPKATDKAKSKKGII